MTLENYIEGLSPMEVKDLIFCIRNFGGPTGVVADENTLKFFRKAYADACIERALDSNKLDDKGVYYIQKLQNILT
jgi:hypothetical protein